MYHRALKLIRQYHRLTQAELSHKLNLSKSFISELEKDGGKKPSIDILERYSNYFDIPTSSLLLFAEQTAKDQFSERARVYTADKVLRMLEWLEHTTRPDHATDSVK